MVTKRETKDGLVDKVQVNLFNRSKDDLLSSNKDGCETSSQFRRRIHVLFCQDLVGNQRDQFMESLKNEHDRLINDENSSVSNELSRYFKIKKAKYSRHRTVEYNMENIETYRNQYVGISASLRMIRLYRRRK